MEAPLVPRRPGRLVGPCRPNRIDLHRRGGGRGRPGNHTHLECSEPVYTMLSTRSVAERSWSVRNQSTLRHPQGQSAPERSWSFWYQSTPQNSTGRRNITST